MYYVQIVIGIVKILWNVVYDVVLRLLRLLGITVFAFADDTLLLIPADKASELQSRVNEVMDIIMEEYKKLGLGLNFNKTEVLLFKNYPKTLRSDPEWRVDTLHVGGYALEPQQKMKYLGVMFDTQLKFVEHVHYINAKVGKIIQKLNIVFRNTFGYGNAARRIMTKGCINAVYLYASTIWSPALQYRAVIDSLRAAQRKVNTLCARAYKDTGFAVTTILAGMPPLDMTIEKRNIMHCHSKRWYPLMWSSLQPVEVLRDLPLNALKVMLDQRILEAWESLYTNSIPEGNWVRTLIPTVRWAVEKMEIRPNFLLTQAVTGHGAFNTYLYRIGKRASPMCRCTEAEQTPQHVFKICDLYSDSRPEDWAEGLACERVRQYLIKTMKRLWEEEQDEEKSGLNRVRRRRRT